MTNNPTIDGVSRELLKRCLAELDSRVAASKSCRALRVELRTFLDAPAVERQEQSMKLCPRCANNGRSDDCPECHGRFMWYSKPPQEAYTEWYCRNPYEKLTNSTVGWMAFKAGRDHASNALQSTIAQLQARVQELESGQ